MVVPRFSALRAPQLLNVARGARRSTELQPFRRTAQRSGRRGYASGGEGHGAHESSNLPWAIGAVAVSLPSCYFLLKDPEARHFPPLGPSVHGTAAHHDEHDEEHEEGGEDGEESKEEGSEEQPQEESKEEPKEESKDESSEEPTEESKEESKDESKDDSKDDSNDDSKGEKPAEESKGDADGAEAGNKKSGGAKPLSGTRKTESDAKGGTKVRIDSALGKDINPGHSTREDASGSKKDSATPNKEPLGMNQMSGKQKGFSNTATRHSYDIANDPEKSKKGEGSVETSKSMGTVDPARRQTENKEA